MKPETHYYTTGDEIVRALGTIDMLVLGAGTGATVAGAGHRIKEMCPECLIVISEPDGSTMFNTNGKSHSYLVSYYGYGY